MRPALRPSSSLVPAPSLAAPSVAALSLAALSLAALSLVGVAAAQEPPRAGRGGEAPRGVAAVDSDALAERLARVEELGGRAEAGVRALYAELDAALELRAQDPARVDPSFAQLGRDEQLAWRIAHLRRLEEALIRAYTLIAAGAGREQPPGAGPDGPDLVTTLAAWVGAYRELKALHPGPSAPGGPLARRLTRADEAWEALSRRLDPAVFLDAEPERRLRLPREGPFVSPAAAPSGAEPVTDLLRPPIVTDPPPTAPDERPPAVVVLDVWLLARIEALIEPVTRELNGLRLEQGAREVVEQRTPTATSDEVDAVAALSPPAELAARVERLERERLAVLEDLRHAYRRLLRQARDVRDPVPPAELLDPEALGFGLAPASRAAALEALELVRGEEAAHGPPRLRVARERLLERLTALRQELAAAPGEGATDPVRAVRRALLELQRRGLVERLRGFEAMARREESRLEVAEALLADAAQRLQVADDRLRRVEGRWWEAARRHYGRAALEVALILAGAWLALRAFAAGSRRLVARLTAGEGREAEARARTIQGALVAAVRVGVWLIAALMVLGKFDVDYEPLLLATGGLTLALGFGAQSLVRDFFAGLFIVLENQYAVGDVVELGGHMGAIEAVGLRTTRFRALDGTLHVIPNGEIKQVSNRTHAWARVDLRVQVASYEDPDEVARTIDEIGREMRDEPGWRERLLEAPATVGVEALTADGVELRLFGKTRPGDQWLVARELRRRIKIRFDLAGIDLASSTVQVVAVEPRPSKVRAQGPRASRPAPSAAGQEEGGVDPEHEGARMPGGGE